MSDLISEHISRFYSNVNSVLETRLHNFLFQIINSGDVFVMRELKKPIITENDYKNITQLNLEEYNLCVYEPYRLKLDQEVKIKQLEQKLEETKDIINQALAQENQMYGMNESGAINFRMRKVFSILKELEE